MNVRKDSLVSLLIPWKNFTKSTYFLTVSCNHRTLLDFDRSWGNSFVSQSIIIYLDNVIFAVTMGHINFILYKLSSGLFIKVLMISKAHVICKLISAFHRLASMMENVFHLKIAIIANAQMDGQVFFKIKKQ